MALALGLDTFGATAGGVPGVARAEPTLLPKH